MSTSPHPNHRVPPRRLHLLVSPKQILHNKIRKHKKTHAFSKENHKSSYCCEPRLHSLLVKYLPPSKSVQQLFSSLLIIKLFPNQSWAHPKEQSTAGTNKRWRRIFVGQSWTPKIPICEDLKNQRSNFEAFGWPIGGLRNSKDRIAQFPCSSLEVGRFSRTLRKIMVDLFQMDEKTTINQRIWWYFATGCCSKKKVTTHMETSVRSGTVLTLIRLDPGPSVLASVFRAGQGKEAPFRQKAEAPGKWMLYSRILEDDLTKCINMTHVKTKVHENSTFTPKVEIEVTSTFAFGLLQPRISPTKIGPKVRLGIARDLTWFDQSTYTKNVEFRLKFIFCTYACFFEVGNIWQTKKTARTCRNGWYFFKAAPLNSGV